ncbi:DUF4089 domain-containing protein [Sulfuriferula nivalis]|uniref:DUF4089 domain-containing protein n=1 Tax=Sulfuriferula nivalis TaxID=2675298 RepID=A0A809RJG2_9PROT|nr:DUF4089 domain-containing protein [Sulfuriferula nivalis]BBP00964.1 hypothetical protein SFSGTM_16720 [Sulfuriferula nivalis]
MINKIYLEEYVKVALSLQGTEVDKQRLASIVQQFALLTSMTNSFIDEPLSAELESAAIYRL